MLPGQRCVSTGQRRGKKRAAEQNSAAPMTRFHVLYPLRLLSCSLR